ncbi:TRAP transporter small permease subunit [Thermus antranikianii]|jgi:TRAP-type mannitol/chloroaromatic compound transport system permease small subunit|uniref:TRAP transporter small permease subunit n=2 Tax=Thermus antranikianii TaxID=88190 RepID=A0ABY7RQW3_9DEIN|nr:TRAP transporter small permease subunit [Thermus antranikianii]
MVKLLRAIDLINASLSRFSSIFMVLLVLTLTYEVGMRYLFKSPTLWSYDMSYMLTSLFMVLSLGHVLQRGEHVRVDLLSHYLPPRWAATVEALLYLVLLFPFLYVLLSPMPGHVLNSWRIGERYTAGTWLPPIYPFKTWVMVGMFLLALQSLAQFLRVLILALRGEEV